MMKKNTFSELFRYHKNNTSLEEIIKKANLPLPTLEKWLKGAAQPNTVEELEKCIQGLTLKGAESRKSELELRTEFYVACNLQKHLFSHLLKKYRKSKQYSSIKLAQLIKVDRKTIERWEAGESMPNPKMKEKIMRCAQELSLDQHEISDFLKAAGYTESISLTPFTYTRPCKPNQFFGHHDIISQILKEWAPPMSMRHIMLYGKKGCGKTSLLRYIFDLGKNEGKGQNKWGVPKGYWIFIDFKDICHRNEKELMRYILEELQIDIPSPLDLFHFKKLLAKGLDKPLFLLLDNVDIGYECSDISDTFWNVLVGLGRDNDLLELLILGTCRFIPEDRCMAQKTPSPIFTIISLQIEVTPFSKDNAVEFIKILQKACPEPAKDPEAWKWILEHSLGWATLMQRMGTAYKDAICKNPTMPATEWQKECINIIKLYCP